MSMISSRDNCPWLSVIIPIYNKEKYLRECLDSITAQTFGDFEVILADDGSTDSSGEICKAYAERDSRMHYFKKENGGVFQTKIFGAEKASGTYITFCDSDDFYADKNAFRVMYDELASGSYSVLQFGYFKKYNHLKRIIKAVNEPVIVDRETFLSREYPKLLCSHWDSSRLTTSVCNKVYHRKLFENLPRSDESERVFWGDDQIINLHLLSKGESLRIIPKPLYCYRRFSGGTNDFSLHTMEDVDTIKKYQLYFLDSYSGDSKNQMKEVLFYELADWFFNYVQQALNHLDKKHLRSLIEDTLQLPRFKLAEEYYLTNKEESREAANLLRKADADSYIIKATEYHSKKSAKDLLISFLKKIYASV